MTEKRDTYYDFTDVVPELIATAETSDYVESKMMMQAAREIAELRRCVRSVVDAYCLADQFSDGHKKVILGDQWHVWAHTLILNRTFTTAKEATP